MKRSDTKILTTHVGSLPFPTPDSGLAVGDASHLAADVAAVVARQRAAGIDIVNEGEYAKGGDWLRYMQNRFDGFAEIAEPAGKPLIEQGKDRKEFSEFYRYAGERGTLFYAPGAQIAKKRPVQACTGPVTYTGHAEVKQEIDVTIAAPASTTCSSLRPHRRASKSIGTIASTRATKTTCMRWPKRCAPNTR
jgi:5-methyltetrahydropteroyltriglutamate--homocysteine methyltransferase